MLPYNHLNTDHFQHIIGYLSTRSPSILDFISYLPIIGACQSWRNAALPVVYNKLYVDYHFKTRRNLRRIVNGNAIYFSNAGLIKAAGASGLVKECKLKLYGLHQLYVCMKESDIFISNTFSWPSINKLNVQLSTLNDSLYKDVNYYMITDKIYMHFPNVSSISFVDEVPSGSIGIFRSHILNKYSKNLLKLDTNINWHLNGRPRLHNITALTIQTFKDLNKLMSCIKNQMLRHLELYDIPLNFKWNVFANTCNGDAPIKFDSLVNLKLSYTSAKFNFSSQPDMFDSPVTFEYPALKTFHLSRHISGNLTEDVKHVFPETIKSIRVDGSAYMANWVEKQNFKQCEHLEIINCFRHLFVNEEYSMQDTSDALNSIFYMHKRYKSVCAKVNIPRIFIKQKALYWNNLERLEMDNEIAFENLVQFIKTLPELKELNAKHVSFQARPCFKACARDKRIQQHLKPIDSKLYRLKIKCANRYRNTDYNVWCLDRLLLRLCNLRVFVSDEYIADGLQGFGELFKSEYPHSKLLNLCSHFKLI